MMQKIMCKCPWGMTILRVVVGIVFLAHGMSKLQNMEGTISFFASLGMAPFLAYLVAWAETLSGIMLIVGFMTMYASYVIAIIMIVAIFTVKLKAGLLGGFELDLVLLASALALAWSNTSHMSLDKAMGMKCGCGSCTMCKSNCDNCDGCKDKCSGHEMK